MPNSTRVEASTRSIPNYTTLTVFIEMTISASDVKGKDIDVDDGDKSRTTIVISIKTFSVV